MEQSSASQRPEQLDAPEPRWPAFIAVFAAGGLYAALPASLAVGPRWLELSLISLIAVPTALSNKLGNTRLNQVLGHLLSGVLTVFMLWSLVLLVRALPAHVETPVRLLRSAAALWATNVLVFALWYWRLDAGGPHGRDQRLGHTEGSFLFPQMTLADKGESLNDGGPWSPAFIDYLFLAFNTSTAFSPTDSPVLSRWAKVLTMLQSSISLTVVVILAARAVNIL
jgi:hypothetical protein